MIRTDVVIIGGGWSGTIFGLEYKLKHPNSKILIIEKDKNPGGLLKTEIINGHTFDIAGSHIIFSRNSEVLGKMLKILNNEVIESKRRAYVRIDNLLIPYPIENNLNYLPLHERIKALTSFLEVMIEAKFKKKPKCLKEWICNFFGEWIAKNYMIPYNLKIWKRPLEKIDVDWIFTPGRLPIPQWREVVESAFGKEVTGYKEQSKFYYPKIGGIQKLFDKARELALKNDVKFITNYYVSKIKKKRNRWIIKDEIEAKKLVNTIPLSIFVQKLDNVDNELLKLSKKLEYNKLLVTGIALNKRAPHQHWIYVPSEKIIFHRYSWISNYSPFNAPKYQSTIITESTFLPTIDLNIEEYEENVIEGLKMLDVITKNSEILFRKSWINEFAYPVHTRKSNRARDKIIKELNEMGIIFVGRWGRWIYWNMDKIYEDVINIVNRI